MRLVLWRYDEKNKCWSSRKLIENAEIVWRERAYDIGQFDLKMPVNDEIIEILQGTCILTRSPMSKIYDFYRYQSEYYGTVMLVEQYTLSDQISEGQTIRLLGRSFEAVLSRRILMNISPGSWTWGAKPYIVNDMRAPEAVSQMIHDMVCDDSACPERYMPNVKPFIDYTPNVYGNLTGQYDKISGEYEGDNLLDVVQDLRDKHRFLIIPMWKQLVNDEGELDAKVLLTICDGYDYTTGDNTVIVSAENDDITESEYQLNVTKAVSNVVAAGTIRAEGQDDEDFYVLSGFYESNDQAFDRFEKFVDLRSMTSDDISYPMPMPTAVGQEAAKYLKVKEKKFSILESKDAHFKAGIDYHLGDKVIARDSFGNIGTVKCVELTFVTDNDGDRIIPTFDEWEDVEVVFCDSTLAEFRSSDDAQIIVRGGSSNVRT